MAYDFISITTALDHADDTIPVCCGVMADIRAMLHIKFDQLRAGRLAGFPQRTKSQAVIGWDLQVKM